MLGRLRMSLEECEEAYINLSAHIFTPRRSKMNIFSQGKDFLQANGKFDAQVLETAIKGQIEGQLRRSKDRSRPSQETAQAGHSKTSVTEDASKILLKDPDPACKVFVVAARQTNSELALLRSYKNSKIAEVLFDECTIWQACRATSAAPMFFDPIEIGRYNQVFIDGGILSNNPVELVHREAKQIWGTAEEPLLVSIGTGSAPGGFFGKNLRGIVEAMQNIVTQTERTASDFHYQHDTMIAKNLYFRFNVTRGLADVDLAEHQARPKIADATQVYLDEGETNRKLTQCINRIKHMYRGYRIDGGRVGGARYDPSHLVSSDPENDRQDLIRRKGRRVEGTCLWILHCQQYKTWLNTDSQMLWISGSPGRGKTMLSDFLVGEIQGILQESYGHILYFFCDHQDQRRNSAIAILRGLLYHALKQGVPVPSRVLDRLLDSNLAQGDIMNLEALWSLYESLVFEESVGTLYCLIDGLDECDTEPIERLIEKFSSLILSGGPAHAPSLKIIMTSRKSPRDFGIGEFSHPHLRLGFDEADDTGKDIDLFITTKVDEMASRNKFSDALTEEVMETIHTKAEGTFLWAALAIDNLKKKKRFEILPTLRNLPKGLTNLYTRMLSQIDEDRRPMVAFILRWVIGSVRPLFRDELEGILRHKEPYSDALEATATTTEYIEICDQFVSERNGRIRLLHQTVADFFLNGKTNFSPELQPFYVTETEMHAKIAEFCISYLQAGAFEHGACSINVSQHVWRTENFDLTPASARLRDFPLLPYAALLWPQHVKKASHADLEVLDLLSPFNTESQFGKAWLETYWVKQCEPVPTGFSLSHIASFLGLEDLMNKLLAQRSWTEPVEMESFVNAQDNYGRTPLWYAASNGYLGIVRLLVEHGANLETRDKRGTVDVENTLIEVVQGSLGIGGADEAGQKQTTAYSVTPGGSHGEGDTPLLRAVKMDFEHVAQYLITENANVDAKDRYGSTPLHESAYHGNDTIMRLLLQRGAKADARDWGGRTPLFSIIKDSPRSTLRVFTQSTKTPGITERDRAMALMRPITLARLPVTFNFPHLQDSARSIIITGDDFPEAEFLAMVITQSGAPGVDADQEKYVMRTPMEMSQDQLSQNPLFTVRSRPPISRTKEVNQAAVDLLLLHSVDTNARNVDGDTALHHAALGGSGILVTSLIKAGADVNARNAGGKTPLYLVLISKADPNYNETIFEQLVAAGADINATDSRGTPLWYDIMLKGDDKLVKLLLRNGANINAKLPFQGSLLTEIMCTGNELLSSTLIAAGADVGVRKGEFSPLNLAIFRGWTAIQEYLFASVIDQDVLSDGEEIPSELSNVHGVRKRIPALWAKATDPEMKQAILSSESQRSSHRVLKYVLRTYQPALNLEDIWGWTPLQYAARFGSVTTNSTLLKHGADANRLLSKDFEPLGKGSSILHLAAANSEHKSKGLVEYYQQKGLDADVQDIYGRTPAHAAALMGTHESFMSLKETSQFNKDLDGHTPMDYAVSNYSRLWFYTLDCQRKEAQKSENSPEKASGLFARLAHKKGEQLRDSEMLTVSLEYVTISIRRYQKEHWR